MENDNVNLSREEGRFFKLKEEWAKKINAICAQEDWSPFHIANEVNIHSDTVKRFLTRQGTQQNKFIVLCNFFKIPDWKKVVDHTADTKSPQQFQSTSNSKGNQGNETDINPVLFYEHTQRFSYLIEDKTKRFVGREYVTNRFDQFAQQNDRGYFLLQGEPGEGKSAIAAQYAKTHECLYYFNIRGEGQNTSALFLENICWQLIQRYDLKYCLNNKSAKSLPEGATNNSAFLVRLLGEASRKINNSKIIIVVDALDEVDLNSQNKNENVLFLPKHLPENVYFFLTLRRDVSQLVGRLGFETHQIKVNLADFPQSYDDIEEYICNFLNDETYKYNIETWLTRRGVDQDWLVSQLKEKSQRNFLYISLILPELANPEGIYKDALQNELPEGLNRYYDKHWALMDVSVDRLRIVCVICRATKIYTCEQIAYLAGEKDLLKVQLILNDWLQFLDPRKDKQNKKRYGFYHESYKDYVFMKDQVKYACGDPKETDRRILDNILPQDIII